jgi:hypothetical protein
VRVRDKGPVERQRHGDARDSRFQLPPKTTRQATHQHLSRKAIEEQDYRVAREGRNSETKRRWRRYCRFQLPSEATREATHQHLQTKDRTKSRKETSDMMKCERERRRVSLSQVHEKEISCPPRPHTTT